MQLHGLLGAPSGQEHGVAEILIDFIHTQLSAVSAVHPSSQREKQECCFNKFLLTWSAVRHINLNVVQS